MCPLTKKTLLDNPTAMNAPSQNLCIPLKKMMGRETKDTFTKFATLFQFLDNIAGEDTLPAVMADYVPFSTMTNCYLSAQ